MKIPIDTEVALSIIDQAVELEVDFITEAVPCDLIGMNPSMMRKHIIHTGERMKCELGLPYKNTESPFPWYEMSLMVGKANFFESKETSYQKANVLPASQGIETHAVRFDSDQEF